MAFAFVYVSRSTLFAVPFDLDRLELRAKPPPMLGDVAYSNAYGFAQFDLSGAAPSSQKYTGEACLRVEG